MNIEEHVALSRYTTLGTGGPARAFARPESAAGVEELLRWAAERGLAVATVGLGSNLLVADDGVDALVLRLAGDLTRVEVDGDLLGAGGGAANAVCLHRARVATADGCDWCTPAELGLAYRHSDLRHGQVVVAAELRLAPGDPEAIKARVRQLNAERKAAQPTNRRTFGSVFKNPEHELSAGRMLEACGLKGHRVGGAQISPKHANFIENAGGARSAHALALMQEARRRALEQFGVELRHEVELLGPIGPPPL